MLGSVRRQIYLAAIGVVALGGCSGGFAGGPAASDGGRILQEADLDLDWSRTGETVGILGHGCEIPDRIWQRAGGSFTGSSFDSDDLRLRLAQGVIAVDDAAGVYDQIVPAAPDCGHEPIEGALLGQEATWWRKEGIGGHESVSVLIRGNGETLHWFISSSALPREGQQDLLVDFAHRAGLKS